ncbi:epidermal growth factor receptor-like [Ischnura elegans]|uniref:epidermal growth factor receptor-like n=1 Tax=Ischnura elegans TaxID=197161 RepID=UPI001ED88B6D|nr:epidermal growth factor receptor-like [Ischnura elegans]
MELPALSSPLAMRRALLLLLTASCAVIASAATREEKVCEGTHRGLEEPSNYDSYLSDMRQRYTGCTFVRGNLELTWLRSQDLDLSFLSDIREVSGYVLMYNVGARRVPLTSLQIIRGEKLMKTTARSESFALLATIVTTQYLEMPALREIRRGTVGFLQSYNLCHIKEIKWKYINNDWNSNIFDINDEDAQCAPCDATCSDGCWGPGPQNCQTINSINCNSNCPGRCFGVGAMECCHSYCSVGCKGPAPNDCIACRHYMNEGTCVITCPRGKYKYGATCVRNCPSPMVKDHDACVPFCPPGKRAVQGECIACRGACEKVCDGVGLIHAGNVASLRNCTTIQGSLEIKSISFTGFQQFHSNFAAGPLIEEMNPHALEALSTVKEITGHLSVSGTHTEFKDLSFFRSLEVIKGDVLNEDQAALSIERTSLRTLDLRSLKTVTNGNIIIRDNVDLCLLKHRDWNAVKKSRTHSVQIEGNRPSKVCEENGFLCHHQCSSEGCWGTAMDECYSCTNYKLKESCLGPCLNQSEQAGSMIDDQEVCFTKAFLPGISLYILNENTKELVEGLAWDSNLAHAYVTTHKQYQIWMKHLAGQSVSSPQNETDDLRDCPNRNANWVDASNGNIPPGGFLGGTDPKCMLYVGRTRHDGELLPGKICPRYNSVYVAWRGREHIYNNYQVLVGSNYEWVLSSGRRIPSCAVEGGKLKDGSPVYIGRTYNAGALDIGRVNPADGTLYIPYYEKEYSFPAYEILVYKSQKTIDAEANEIRSSQCTQMIPVWEEAPTGEIATDRLVATNNPKCNYYVGRAFHDRDLIPGKFIPDWRNVYIAWGGEEIAYQKAELLIGSNYEWVPAVRGKIPSCAVKGGYTMDGTPLYIGKVLYNECDEIGKVNPVDGLLYVGYFNKEYTFTEYDILVFKTQ